MKFTRKRATISATSQSGRIDKVASSATTEANLLFEILQELKKQNKKERKTVKKDK